MTNHTDTFRFLKEVFPDFRSRAIFVCNFAAGGMANTRDIAKLDPARDCYLSSGAYPDDGNATRKGRVQEVRVLVIDDVGTALSDVFTGEAISKVTPAAASRLGAVTAVIRTSPDNHHYWFKLSRPVLPGEWRAFRAAVDAVLGTVPDGAPAGHIFRLPMGMNTKRGCRVELVSMDEKAAALDVDAMLAAHAGNRGLAGLAGLAGRPGPSKKAGGSQRVHDIRGLVKLWPNNAEYDEWINTGERIVALARDREAGREAFHEWSARATLKVYREDYTETKWRSLTADNTRGQKLLDDIRAHDPVGFDAWWQKEAGPEFDDGANHAAVGTAGRYDAAQVDMAEHIIGVERARLGWLHEAPKTWLGFDPVVHRWMRSGEDLLRGVVWEEITRRRTLGVDSKTSRSMKSGAWHAAVTALLTKNPLLRLSPDLFDANKDTLGLPLGVMEIDSFGSGTIRPGRASDYITKSTAVMPAAAGTKSAVWEKFLDEFTLGDLELRTWLQVYMGYCLTGHTLHERVVFAYGAGGSGKGVFFGTCGAVMGDYATEAGQATFMQKGRGPAPHSTDLAVLEGLRMVVVPEVPDNAAWDMELIKRISGGDLIAARRMFQDQRAWRPQLKLVVVGNDQPEITKVDDAVRRRLLTVWARYKAPVCDEQLKTKMRTTEGPAVLRWMIDGWEMWEAAGRRLPVCRGIEDASKAYLSASDVFGRWKEECLERVMDVNACVRVKDVFDSWSMFKMSEGSINLAPNASKNLMIRLNEGEAKPFQTRYDHSGASVIVGLKLNKPTSSTVF